MEYVFAGRVGHRRLGRRCAAVGVATLCSIGCTERASTRHLTLAVASTGGTFYALGEAIAEVIRRDTDIDVSVTASHVAANSARVGRGDVDLALAFSTNTLAALRGKPPFGRAYPEVRALARLYDGYYHFVIARRTGISAFREIRERRFPLRVSTNTVGSPMDVSTAQIFLLHGMSFDELRAWGGEVLYLSSTRAQELLADGQLDAIVTTGPIPVRAIQMTHVSQEVDVLPLSPGEIARLNEEYGASRATIPAHTYQGQPHDLPTVTESVLLIASARLPDATAFEIGRALERRRSRLAQVYGILAGVTAAYLAETGAVPLHDGARAYYRDRREP